MERRGYALKIAYRGGAFHGWQRQPGVATVQQTLEDALAALDLDVRLAAAARTDAGVSARAQVVSFRLRRALRASEVLTPLQAALPRALRLLSWAEVDGSFHARSSALTREYRYRVDGPTGHLDLGAAHTFLAGLTGMQDRRPYVWRPEGPCVSNVEVAELRARPGGGLVLRFIADRYGRRLVRNWVWAALAAARGEPGTGATALGWRGPTAPGAGLLLWEVRYLRDPFVGTGDQKRSCPPSWVSNAVKIDWPKVTPSPS
jgi:tRNA pseudouridine38-40 synthase